MQTTLYLVSDLLISFLFTGTSLLILSKPLVNILGELCPTKVRANFWLSYTQLMLIISPLFMVFIVDGIFSSNTLLEHVRVSVVSALSGLLLAMMIIGRHVIEPVTQQGKSEGEGWGS